MTSSLLRWGGNLLDLFFPRVCTVCHTPLVEGEDLMCLGCLMELPRVEFDDYRDNELADRLASLRAPIEKAASLYYHMSGAPHVSLIHDAKYNRRPIVGRKLARMHAGQLATAGFFDDIDVLMPVPLHFTKLWMRGYNQSNEIARGLSDVTGLPIGDNLTASRPHSTQTRKNASQRSTNSIGTFRVTNPEQLDSLHILVVDDVITTGSNKLSALETIHTSAPTVRLSVYSLALSKLR